MILCWCRGINGLLEQAIAIIMRPLVPGVPLEEVKYKSEPTPCMRHYSTSNDGVLISWWTRTYTQVTFETTIPVAFWKWFHFWFQVSRWSYKRELNQCNWYVKTRSFLPGNAVEITVRFFLENAYFPIKFPPNFRGFLLKFLQKIL